MKLLIRMAFICTIYYACSLIETMGKSARVEHLNEHADEEKDHAERLTMMFSLAAQLSISIFM